ncbi:MAG TPA: 2OG-Fe(II) oxygenase [Trebonia sp.]|nr:2OG-Fe(II) oxygenase [Trebonia sp.]
MSSRAAKQLAVRMNAEPHALLVYGTGQFFLPHQDSEKDDTMIGTLVVSLPSSHTGGELVIEHNDKTVAYQASATEVSVAACLLPTLRAAGPGPSAPLQELARDCERRLTAITERPARADDDWSVPWSGGCGCELCGTLGEFLADRGERTREWPLAEARRRHVMDQISAAELPVKHEIWKFGSPHTLVLTKTDELFRREAKARKDAAASLQWLAVQRRR